MPCWLTGHDWQREVTGLYLHIGTEHERQCDIVTCRVCRKAKVSYGMYPPRRMPRGSSDAELVKIARMAADAPFEPGKWFVSGNGQVAMSGTLEGAYSRWCERNKRV